MRRARRLVLAAFIAPAAPILLILSRQLTGTAHTNLSDWGDEYVLVLILLGSYAISIVVGIPAYLLVRRLHQQGWQIYLGAAFLSGAASVPLSIVGLLLWVLFRAGAEKFQQAIQIFLDGRRYALGACIAVGLLFAPIGLLFWFLARPERDESAQR